MNSIVLRSLAGVLAAGALLAAWLGYRLGSEPAEPEAAPPAAHVPVMAPAVLAARPIAPGQLIGAEDVTLGAVEEPAPKGVGRVEAVVGRLAVAHVASGEAVLPGHLAQQGAVTPLLGAGERAVAVKVDDVVAVGGFLRPGDRVDVLLYLRAERETDNRASAQVALENLRVLAVGELVPESPEPAGASEAASGKDGLVSRSSGDSREDAKKKAGATRAVVLAVPAAEAARLMLAASGGTLRLALRGNAEMAAAGTAPIAARPLRLDELARGEDASARTGGTQAPRTAARRVESGHRVTGHRGEQVEVVSVGAR
ncbi:Flp pilus assembly protein CpaB [Pseudothauera rhizosphaerae]|uniref:Flp pilus assembly protein CpaB n=1 Tax=Pseudothauera rhizosphaerae TaxID=2565932 RepID=UPI001454BC8C|nr:Flp pilus assembly protein CpaB [Pseudothauera rhizosphaerae]